MVKYSGVVLAVEDMEASKAFYTQCLGQTVVMDFGWNVAFADGLALQSHFDEIMSVPKESMVKKSHSFELYFEVDDFEGMMEKLSSMGEAIRYLHPPKQYPWLQWVVRVYDPDENLVEISESMTVVIEKCLRSGMSVDETVKATQHPKSMVEEVAKGLL